MLLTPIQIIQRFNTLKGIRGNWETHWQELADFILPRKNDIIQFKSPGEKRNIQVLDNTAMISNEQLAAALHSFLSNPNTQFFEFTTGDQDLDERDDVRLWLQDSARRVLNVLNNTNYQTEIHELYLDICCFGTGIMNIMEDPNDVVRFKTESLSKIVVDENNFGEVDELYHQFRWNAKKIVQEFGEEVPPKVTDSLEKEPDRKFEIIHAIYPKEIRKASKTPMQFHSQFILVEDSSDLSVKGFREFPYVVPRWTKISGEIYGRSPGMNALPEQKTLNKMTETTLKGAQKVVDPPLQVPDDGFITNIRTRPGSLNFFRSGSTDRITPVFNDTRIDFGFQAMEAKRIRVKEAYFADQLKLGVGPQMTATEVEQRAQESLRLLGPNMGRQQVETLTPMMARVFGIMDRKEMFKPKPDALREVRNLEVRYSSVMARAQKISEGRSITRTFEQIASFGQIDPSAFDNFDVDKITKGVAKLNSFPQEMLRNQKEIEEIRSARQAANEAAAAEASQSRAADNFAKTAAGAGQLR